MAKKKNSPKKHKFKHVDTEALLQSDSAPASGSVGSGVSRSNTSVQAAVGGRDFGYVAKDIRRIGIMASILVVVELSFYYLLVFTPIGAAVYRMVAV